MEKKIELSHQQIFAANAETIREISGVNVFACYQCGNCTATCPATEFMDLMPHEVIRRLQLGLTEEMLASRTPWICLACLNCSARCPRSIDIARVMEGCRSLILRQKYESYNIHQALSEAARLELPPIALIASFRKNLL